MFLFFFQSLPLLHKSPAGLVKKAGCCDTVSKLRSREQGVTLCRASLLGSGGSRFPFHRTARDEPVQDQGHKSKYKVEGILV